MSAITRQTDAKFVSHNELQISCEGRVNVNNGIAIHSPHDRGGSAWSGCYYVKIPEKLALPKKTGAIVFVVLRTRVSCIEVFRKALQNLL